MSKRNFFNAVADATDGIARAFVDQPNFRVQILLAIVAVIVAAFLHFSLFQWMILALTICLVLAAELFNTCVEHVVDLVQPDSHPLARAAKHAGAGAVLVVSGMAAIIAIYLYGGAILRR